MSTEGQLVIEFARKKKGHRVGDGECWTLAERALEHAKAVTSTDIDGDPSKVDEYRWGDLITVGEARPGDIIQFLNGWAFDKWITNADDQGWDGGGVGPVVIHHTAIVDEILIPGVSFNVLHQNWEDKKKVVLTELYFKKHSYTDHDGNSVKVTVKGRAKFYRPRPKP